MNHLTHFLVGNESIQNIKNPQFSDFPFTLSNMINPWFAYGIVKGKLRRQRERVNSLVQIRFCNMLSLWIIVLTIYAWFS